MLIFDIETDALDINKITTIHTISIFDTNTNEMHTFDKEDVSAGIERLMRDPEETICGHNIIDYDIPAIQKFYPEFKPKKVFDTLVAARLVFNGIEMSDLGRRQKGTLPPRLIGSHSLEAYGFRMGVFKGDFKHTHTFEEWSPDMSEYCRQDVVVTAELLKRIKQKGYSKLAMKIEHGVQKIITRQTQHGFKFNTEKAEELYIRLKREEEETIEKLKERFKPVYKSLGEFTPKVNNKTRGYIKGVPFTKVVLTEFNPRSHQQVAERLMKEYGWKPEKFSPTGQPVVDEEVLSKLDYDVIPLLLKMLLLSKRIGQLAEGRNALLKCVASNGRMYGRVNPNGTRTGRMTHKEPNMAQVPSVDSPYGREFRSLFTVEDGYTLVGIDASGLELRIMAHYLNSFDEGAYIKEILDGDIHTKNQKAAGLDTRPDAKRFIYAFIYGAGNELLGSIVAPDEKKKSKLKKLGQQLRTRFLKNTPALRRLQDVVIRQVKKHRGVIGLDGRFLPVYKEHTGLNTLFQSAGSIVMKYALCLLDQKLQREHNLIAGVDYEFCVNVHDEWQIESLDKHAELVGQVGVQAIQEAGKKLKVACPLDGEYKIGKTWAETH